MGRGWVVVGEEGGKAKTPLCTTGGSILMDWMGFWGGSFGSVWSTRNAMVCVWGSSAESQFSHG